MFDALADDVQLPLEGEGIRGERGFGRGAGANEDLLHDRTGRDRGCAEMAVVDRHLAPAEHHLRLFSDDVRERRARGITRRGMGR